MSTTRLFVGVDADAEWPPGFVGRVDEDVAERAVRAAVAHVVDDEVEEDARGSVLVVEEEDGELLVDVEDVLEGALGVVEAEDGVDELVDEDVAAVGGGAVDPGDGLVVEEVEEVLSAPEGEGPPDADGREGRAVADGVGVGPVPVVLEGDLFVERGES